MIHDFPATGEGWEFEAAERDGRSCGYEPAVKTGPVRVADNPGCLCPGAIVRVGAAYGLVEGPEPAADGRPVWRMSFTAPPGVTDMTAALAGGWADMEVVGQARRCKFPAAPVTEAS
jgi:hypothetical protein